LLFLYKYNAPSELKSLDFIMIFQKTTPENLKMEEEGILDLPLQILVSHYYNNLFFDL
jgi:hypothetical protein